MHKIYLGEFEELLLTVEGIPGGKAYENAITQEIKKHLNRGGNFKMKFYSSH